MGVRLWRPLALAAALGIPTLEAAQLGATFHAPNPVRKVVNLLEAMKKKVEEEGQREQELYDAFQCYCNNGRGKLEKSVADANTKIPSLEADITSAAERKTELEGQLKQERADREAAKSNIQQATVLREKQAAAFAAEKAEADKNIDAIKRAVGALQKGMGGAFLQTLTAQQVHKIAMDTQEMSDEDRQEVLSFLSGQEGSNYEPQGGEVVGILKQLGDQMANALADSTDAEKASVQSFNDLVAAKKKETEALTESIESKTQRVGELAVSAVQMQNDLDNTRQQLVEDSKLLANLDQSCKEKKKEFEERIQTRSEELIAISETIKLLNDDDALDLFKKTLPSPSFMQVSTSVTRKHGLAALAQARRGVHHQRRIQLDLIALALKGKKVGFEKVAQMIDGMVATLKKEQDDDNKKKEYCDAQLTQAGDKKKDLEGSKSKTVALIAQKEEAVAATMADKETLEKSIKELDKSVKQATEQRKKENEEFQQTMSSNSAAKDLLGVAKNRLNKFYNPKLYKEAPKVERSTQDRIYQSSMGISSFVQVSAQRRHHRSRQPGAPATPNGPYQKSEESSGVIAMIDMLIKDLDKDMTEAKAEEANAQKEYESLMKESAAKRMQDTKSLSQKESILGALKSDLELLADQKKSTEKELKATITYIGTLHGECDWLLQYFDTRRKARTSEIDSMQKAKAVLAGANYALPQVDQNQGFLSRNS